MDYSDSELFSIILSELFENKNMEENMVVFVTANIH